VHIGGLRQIAVSRAKWSVRMVKVNFDLSGSDITSRYVKHKSHWDDMTLYSCGYEIHAKLIFSIVI
jgi:hypothetical protein